MGGCVSAEAESPEAKRSKELEKAIREVRHLFAFDGGHPSRPELQISGASEQEIDADPSS